MAASGAAVNPDAASSGVGPQRNTLFAILMALLNIRLGIWIANPTKHAYQRRTPAPNHFNPGFWGVVDRITQTGRFVEITDGGNFENLGVMSCSVGACGRLSRAMRELTRRLLLRIFRT